MAGARVEGTQRSTTIPHRPNGTYVSNADALTAWTPVAREILLETSTADPAVITYRDLAEEVQVRSGVSTDLQPAQWISRLLARVDADADRRGEPRLGAFCVAPPIAVVERLTRAPRTRQPAAPRRLASETTRSEVTCPSCFIIVAAGATCSSCGAPLPS